MADLDLDARREALGKGPVLIFKGQTFELAPEMPFSLVEAWDRNASWIEYCQLLLGEHWEAFKALGPSLEEIKTLCRHNYWSVSEGEGQASGDSSQNGGTRSRPTSSGNTTSTSAKRSGAKKRSASAASSP
jgi:hypothetical protein